jgi:hypothetical protein
MGEDNRQRARMFRSYVDEMNVETIDLSVELWETIQRFLTAPPVVISAPVVDERAQLLEGDTFRPVVRRLALRPTGLRQTLFQIIKHTLWRMIGEWYDLFELHLCLNRSLVREFGIVWSTGATEIWFHFCDE